MPFTSRMGMYLSRMGNTAMGQGTTIWTLETIAILSRSSIQRSITGRKASTASASFLWRSSSTKGAQSTTIATRGTWNGVPAKTLTKPLSSTVAIWKPSIPSELLHGTFAVMLHQFGGARSLNASTSSPAQLSPHGGLGQNVASKSATASTAKATVTPSRLPQWLLRAYTNTANTAQSTFVTKNFNAATRKLDGRRSIGISTTAQAILASCAAAISYIIHAAGANPFTSLMGSAKSRMANVVMGQNVSPTSWALATIATFQAGAAQIAQSVSGLLSASLAKVSPNPSGLAQQSAVAKLQPSAAQPHSTVLSAAVAVLRRWLVTATASVVGSVSASTNATAQRMTVRDSRVALPGNTAHLAGWSTGSAKHVSKALNAVLAKFSPVSSPIANLGVAAKMIRVAAQKAVAGAIAGTIARADTWKTVSRRQVSLFRIATLEYATITLTQSLSILTPAALWLSGALNRAVSKMARAKIGKSDGFPTAETVGIANLGAVAKAILFRATPIRQAQTGTAAQTATGQASTISPGFSRFTNALVSLFRATVSAVRRATPAVRKFNAPYQQRLWVIADEAVILTTKDPESVEDFEIDWSIQLGGTDFINSSDWEVSASGLTITQESNTDTTSTARLSGGAMGTTYDVANTVNLASGQVKVRHLMITIQEA